MILEDTANHRKAKLAEARVTALNRLQHVKAEGSKVSALQADPNWEIYGRYLEREKERHEESAKIQEEALLNLENPLLESQALKVRLRLAHNRACVEAYTFALNIAKTLIERGEQAQTEIAKLIDAGEKLE